VVTRKISSRIARALVLAVTATLFSFAPTPVQADFNNAIELAPIGNFKFADLSADANVIAIASGCAECLYFTDYEYARVSTDGGANFTQQTSVGKQAWRGVHVSSNGSTIALVTKLGFYISFNSGSTFTYAHQLTNTLVVLGRTVATSAMTRDGKSVFLGLDNNTVLKITYREDVRRWENTNGYALPVTKSPISIATNSTGSKIYVAVSFGGIYKLVSDRLVLVSGTTTLPRGDEIFWKSIKTNNSGDQIVGIPLNGINGDGYIISVDSGATFNWVTSAAGRTIERVQAIDVSDDGTSIIFATVDSNDVSRVYTRHRSEATFYVRETVSLYQDYEGIAANLDGSSYIAHNQYRNFVNLFYGKPVPPIFTALESRGDSVVALTWGFPSNPGSDYRQAILDVELQYTDNLSGSWTNIYDGNLGGNSRSLQISGLTAFTNYYIRARAINPYGTSDWSSPRGISTSRKPRTPSAPIDANDPDRSVIKFLYQPGATYPGESIYSGWSYSTDGGVTWIYYTGINYDYIYKDNDPRKEELGVVISGVEFNKPYTFRTRTWNNSSNFSDTYSDFSPSATFRAFGKPSAPSNLQVNTSFNTATLSWSAPTYLGGDTVNGYIASYKLSNSNTWTDSATTSASAVFSGLQGGSLYDYKVVATTENNQQSLAAFYYNDRPINPPTKVGISRNSSGFNSGLAFTTQPQVQVQDVNSTAVTTDSRSIIYASVNNGATLIGLDSATVTSGVATFSDLGLKGTAGRSYQISYRSGDLTLATETVTLTAGTASLLRFSTNSVGGAVNTVFSTVPEIEIVDADGNRITTDDTTTVTVTVNNGYISDGVNSPVTARAAQGLATFSGVRLLGANGETTTLTYTATNLGSIQETLTITTGPAATLTRTTRAQDGYVGGKFGTQPVYSVTDTSGNPVTESNYLVTISPSTGTLTGQRSVFTENGIATFTDLGIAGVSANQMVILTVTSDGFTPYTGDSVITRQGTPRLGWNDLFIPQGTANFEVPIPDSSTPGTFSYSSSNTSVINFSGSQVVVGSTGSAVITATFTPSNTTDYQSGETVTATFTVTQSAGSVIVSTSAGATAQKGISNTLTASVSTLGNVTFFINGKRVPGCISVKSLSGVATCSWKPASQGSVTLSARLIPQDVAIDPVTSAPLNVSIVRRTNRR
jgi:hypothetical protein